PPRDSRRWHFGAAGKSWRPEAPSSSPSSRPRSSRPRAGVERPFYGRQAPLLTGRQASTADQAEQACERDRTSRRRSFCGQTITVAASEVETAGSAHEPERGQLFRIGSEERGDGIPRSGGPSGSCVSAAFRWVILNMFV